LGGWFICGVSNGLFISRPLTSFFGKYQNIVITIIGGGIGGLTTALALEKVGLDYQVFERAPALKPVGAGIWLAPNALQVLDRLGLLEEVQQAGNTINRILLGQPDMYPLSGSDQQAAIDRFGFSTVAIHRAALLKVLYRQLPVGKVHLGKAFEGFTELEDGRIEIRFTDESAVTTDAGLAPR
jgi:2-polyprenyl-6-methoxyphenol hydroxylase-like FAD-dependent oxidoreductase